MGIAALRALSGVNGLLWFRPETEEDHAAVCQVCIMFLLRSETNRPSRSSINILKPTGYVMHHQFNIQQLYALPTLYLCVLYLSENKQRLVPLTA